MIMAKAGHSLSPTSPDSRRLRANSAMTGPTNFSQAKNKGMTSRRRTWTPIQTKEKALSPGPDRKASAIRTIHAGRPSASPSLKVPVSPRDSLSQAPNF